MAWFDAYWIFRQHPPWLAATHGANRLLDRQTRRAKILQALSRDYSTALVGSSTVYHGLDPADADKAAPGSIFNVGISALMGDELPTVAAVVASRHDVSRVVVALDYYMFSRTDPPVAIDRSLATATGRWNARLGSLFGRYALMDSRFDEVEGGDDPGAWTYDGFRITPPLSARLTELNAATRRKTTAAYRPEMLDALDTALSRLKGLDTTVYLSPVSDAQRRILSDLGFLDDFARWRADVARLVASHGMRFLDLADLGDAFPFDPAKGSTDVWIDNLHFTPILGDLVLERLGLRTPRPRG